MSQASVYRHDSIACCLEPRVSYSCTFERSSILKSRHLMTGWNLSTFAVLITTMFVENCHTRDVESSKLRNLCFLQSQYVNKNVNQICTVGILGRRQEQMGWAGGCLGYFWLVLNISMLTCINARHRWGMILDTCSTQTSQETVSTTRSESRPRVTHGAVS